MNKTCLIDVKFKNLSAFLVVNIYVLAMCMFILCASHPTLIYLLQMSFST